MSQMQPALRGLDGVRTLSILHLGNGVVFALIDNLLFLDLGVGNVIDESPADTTARTCIDETILRTGIEGIFTIYKLWMEHHVTLLRLGLQIGQAIPGLQVLRAGDGSRSRGSREIARL